MKYVKAVVCTLIIAILLSGCSFRITSSIEDLIGPVSPFGDNANIQEALSSYVKNGFSLKTPSGGDYIASYSFYDIDKDGMDEAFAFYEPSDNLGTISMAVIKKLDDKWSVVDNIMGDGKDIYSISFDDVNADKRAELLVCWDAISNSSNHNLSVYQVISGKNKLSLKQIGEPVSINNYAVVDFNRNSMKELLLFEINGTSSSAKAELYSLKSNSFKLLGETKLDSHITSYTNIQIEEAENDIRVYADAIGSDGSSMLTEVIYWSDSYASIISPFYSYSTGLTKGTQRNMNLMSRDVNDDGLIEIPSDYKMKKLPDKVRAVDWKIYKSTILVHAEYSLIVADDGYLVVLPDGIIKDISVSYKSGKRQLLVKNKRNKKTVFSIMPVMKASYDEGEYEDYQVVMEASGYYYLAKTGNDSDINISIDDLTALVKSIN